MRSVISFEEFYESIWLKIPEVWRNADSDSGRPLQVLTLTLAQHFYYSFYLKIASMDELFDPDTCPEKYLPFLAGVLNWKLLGTNAASWRNQIRHAPLLYKIKGTRKALTVAEKLVGYSVYMTELYRDYTGNILPKEKLFNAFPLSVKIKPWFRKTTSDISSNIFNDIFSDQLPSFNEQFGDISSLGTLLLPRKLKKSGSRSIPLSSLPNYNPITGVGSLARLSKTSRINVVLKKDLDLDYIDSNGNSLGVSLNEAVDLFLQFKPFHVYIQDLVIMYNLTDYIFGSISNTDAGTGNLPGDVILARDSADIYVTIQEEDSISYYNQDQLGSCDADSLEYSENLKFKGLLETKYIKIQTNQGIFEKDCEYLTSLGFSLSGYSKNIQLDQGKTLWAPNDFILVSNPTLPGVQEENVLVSSESQKIKYANIVPEPKYGFIKIPINLYNITSFSQLFDGIAIQDSNNWFSNIISTSKDSFASYRDSVIIGSHTYNYLSTPSVPLGLRGADVFLQKISQPISYKLFNKDTYVNSTVSINSITQLFKLLFIQPVLILFKKNNCEMFLTHKKHFTYDIKNSCIILNHKNIFDDLSLLYTVDSNTLFSDSSSVIHILYSSLIPTSKDFSLTSSVRSLQLSIDRSQNQFNRITYLDNTENQTQIDLAHYSPVLEFSDSTGTLIEDSIKTKLFKESMPVLYTRNSLHYENTGTPYKAINYNLLTSRDTSQWSVYIDPAELLYSGSERISKTIWSNYFNVPFTGNGLVSYTSIDTSEEAQLSGRSSFRWQSTISNISELHPQYFVASRKNVASRHALWNRGTAAKIAVPYIGSSRNYTQGFRTAALFNRTENLSDYQISLLSNYRTDKYKYTLNKIDYTTVYRTPTIPFEEYPIPSIEIRGSGNTEINDSSITYPSYPNNYSTQYETPFDFTNRLTYYNEDKISLKPSLFANNIRTDTCPYSGELFNDSADPVEFNVIGLTTFTETFVIESPDIKELTLANTNVFVSWREVNTGISMGTGLFPLVNYNRVRPNIKVVKNGIELEYGNYWILASNPNRVILTSSCFIMPEDVLLITYHTLGGVPLPMYPVDPITNIPYTNNNTHLYTDTQLLTTVPNKENLFEILLTHKAVIAWYRSDTGQYINVSVDPGIPGTAIEPAPNAFREVANPTIQVRRNGSILPYLLSWTFKAVPGNISYSIVLDQHISQMLQINDVITVSYTGLLN